MKISLLITFFIILLTATNGFCEYVWKPDMTIKRVQAQSTGGFIIYGPVGADPLCAENGSLFYVEAGHNGQTVDGVKSNLAIVLTAFLNNKPIIFAYDNSNSYCYVGTVKMLV